MLMKDNLIDEDKAKQEEAAHENLQQKIDRLQSSFLCCIVVTGILFRLDCTLESISTRFSRMLAEYTSFQVQHSQIYLAFLCSAMWGSHSYIFCSYSDPSEAETEQAGGRRRGGCRGHRGDRRLSEVM